MLSTLIALSALGGLLVVLRRPYWAAIVVLTFFPLEQLAQSYFPFLQTHGVWLNYFVAAMAAAAVVLRLLRRDAVASGLNNPLTYLVLAQYALWLLGMLYSPAPDAALSSLETSWPYVVLYLFLLPLLLVDLEEFYRILLGLLVMGALFAILIISNPMSSYYGGRLMLDVGTMGLTRERFGNPLAVAELGGMVALVAALITSAARPRMFTVLRIAAFTIGLGLAIVSGSRGQVLATVAAGVLFYPVARRVNNLKTFFLSGVGLLLLVIGIYATFQVFVGEQNRARWDVALMFKDAEQRTGVWWRFLDAWTESPSHWLFGLGTNAWIDISGASEFGGGYVHNVAIEILGEQGLVGASIFVATLVLTARSGKRLWNIYRDDPPMRSAVALLLALGAFALFNALKQGTITSVAPFYWWVILAKVSRHEQLAWRASAAAEAAEAEELEYLENPEYALAR